MNNQDEQVDDDDGKNESDEDSHQSTDLKRNVLQKAEHSNPQNSPDVEKSFDVDRFIERACRRSGKMSILMGEKPHSSDSDSVTDSPNWTVKREMLDENIMRAWLAETSSDSHWSENQEEEVTERDPLYYESDLEEFDTESDTSENAEDDVNNNPYSRIQTEMTNNLIDLNLLSEIEKRNISHVKGNNSENSDQSLCSLTRNCINIICDESLELLSNSSEDTNLSSGIACTHPERTINGIYSDNSGVPLLNVLDDEIIPEECLSNSASSLASNYEATIQDLQDIEFGIQNLKEECGRKKVNCPHCADAENGLVEVKKCSVELPTKSYACKNIKHTFVPKSVLSTISSVKNIDKGLQKTVAAYNVTVTENFDIKNQFKNDSLVSKCRSENSAGDALIKEEITSKLEKEGEIKLDMNTTSEISNQTKCNQLEVIRLENLSNMHIYDISKDFLYSKQTTTKNDSKCSDEIADSQVDEDYQVDKDSLVDKSIIVDKNIQVGEDSLVSKSIPVDN